MTEVELILAALAAGVGAGTSDAAKAAVVDSYAALREALRNRLAGRARALRVLDAAQAEPDVFQTELGPEIEESGADRDEEILAAARRLLALADPDGTGAGVRHVDARQAKGVQVGHHNTQHNTFS